MLPPHGGVAAFPTQVRFPGNTSQARCQKFPSVARLNLTQRAGKAAPPMPDKTLDLKGLACPLPILKTKKALSELPKGATLEVFATDPGAVADFTAFSESTGNALLEHSEAGGVYRFVLRHSA
jgi:tRNA 2-thiouridine synthesizing protein A